MAMFAQSVTLIPAPRLPCDDSDTFQTQSQPCVSNSPPL